MGRTAFTSVNFRRSTLNFQHPARSRTTAISLCVASPRPRAAWRHAHAHDLARAQYSVHAPRRRPRCQVGARKALAQSRQDELQMAPAYDQKAETKSENRRTNVDARGV